MSSSAFAENIDLDAYFSSFDYAERKAMKINSQEALELWGMGDPSFLGSVTGYH